MRVFNQLQFYFNSQHNIILLHNALYIKKFENIYAAN
jgi:hypothetical protein